MNNSTTAVISKYTTKGERILWSGKPQKGGLFNKTDFFIIPFSLVFISFSIFWMFMAMQASVYFALFGIPFVLVGAYLLIGRFIVKITKQKHTYYGITEKQVVMVQGKNNKKVDVLNIIDISSINLTEGSNGVGSITLGGINNTLNSFNQNLPASFQKLNKSAYGEVYPEFERIKNVNHVFHLLKKQQNKLKAEERLNS